ncbi:hypothetical protein [uncultured Friedmanniella sp.]|uniref:hypothetical protein n=1 Tax=uncultured Friedmanniella sp. TaxID=335381 RepID=UPI0035CB1FE0
MQERVDPSPELLQLARAQGGVIPVAQAELLGFGRHPRQRLLGTGQWHRVECSVLAVQSFPVLWDGRAWAGVLLGGRDARLAGPAAAHLHGRRHRRDVRYSAYGVVVELDGRLGHEGLGRFRDMARDNGAVLDGEVTLRYGSAEVFGEACLVARQVGAVLGGPGWRG